MAKTDLVRSMVEPLADAAGARVYDVTLNGGKLVVALTRGDGTSDEGIDLDTLTGIARQLNTRLDEEDPISGSFVLEVTSPGLERNLRTPDHFAGAVGSEVTVRTKPDIEGERRVRGVLTGADDELVTVELEEGGERTLAYADIERARTVFSWGPSEKPGGSKKAGKKPAKKSGQQKSGQQKSNQTKKRERS